MKQFPGFSSVLEPNDQNMVQTIQQNNDNIDVNEEAVPWWFLVSRDGGVLLRPPPPPTVELYSVALAV